MLLLRNTLLAITLKRKNSLNALAKDKQILNIIMSLKIKLMNPLAGNQYKFLTYIALNTTIIQPMHTSLEDTTAKRFNKNEAIMKEV